MASPSRWTTRSHTGRTLVFRSLLTSLIAAATLLLTGAVPAHATDTPAQIEAQIDKQWQALEPIIENYNAIHAKYVSQKSRADKLQKRIEPLQVRVEVALSRVTGYSVSVFENGPAGTLSTLLSAGNQSSALDMLGLLDQMANQQRDEVAGTLALEQKYQAEKKPIDALVASLNTQQKALADDEKTIKAKIADLNRLRLKAYANGSGLGSLKPVACPQKYYGDAGSRAAAFACKQIGDPYVWAAAGPDAYDCSGLTMRSWSSVGVSLPHNAYQQKQVTQRIYGYSNLKPGDLIFYYSTVHHVAIYVGNGWMVNAPQSGDRVRMAKYNAFPINAYGRP